MDQNPISIQCRKCEDCESHRKRRLLGKVIAEQQTCRETWFSTYTYGGGYGNNLAYVLDYRDMQKTFKKMRRAGHKFRYLAVGEYGAEHGRAHWHVVIFWETEPPKMPMGEQTSKAGDGFWEKGIVQHEYPRSQTGVAAYAMKYLTKEPHTKGGLKISTGLGDKYLMNYAREHARASLPLFAQKNTYIIKEQKERSRSGQSFFYPIEPDSGIFDRMMHAWLKEWAKVHPQKPLKTSSYTSEWLENEVQNMDKLTEQEQTYIERHYGYKAVPSLVETHFGIPEEPLATIRSNWAGYALQIHDHKGHTIWLEELNNREAVEDYDITHLPQSVHEQAIQKLKQMEPRLEKIRRANRITMAIKRPKRKPPSQNLSNPRP